MIILDNLIYKIVKLHIFIVMLEIKTNKYKKIIVLLKNKVNHTKFMKL